MQQAEKDLRADQRVRVPVSAEMHINEHDPLFWTRILDRIQDSGIESVSAWVCPNAHRRPDGEFCLTGQANPRTDLSGFLDLCAERDLAVHLQPGLAIVEPLLLDPQSHLVEQWIAAVMQVVRGRQIGGNGPVASVGVDSGAILPVNVLSEHLGCNETGTSSEATLQLAWRRFCSWRAARGQQRTDQEKNALDALQSEDHTQAPPGTLPTMLVDEIGSWVGDTITATVEWVAEIYRAAGIEVPLFMSLPRLAGLLGWQGSSVLDRLGVEIMVPREAHDRSLALDWMVRWARAAIEDPGPSRVQVGVPSELGEYWYPAPGQSESTVMAAHAAGLRGASLCKFVEHGSWSFSPVNATGKVRLERFEPLTRAIASSKALAAVDDQLADVGFLWSPGDHSLACNELGLGWHDLWREETPVASRQWWDAFRRLVEWDSDFCLWIPGVSRGPTPRLLVHAGRPVSTLEQANTLIHAVQDAETLVEITPAISRPDDVGAESLPQLRCNLEAAIDLAPANECDLVATLRQLGARSYSRARHENVRTWMHRRGDSHLLGVWNAGEASFTGEIRLSAGLFEEQRHYRVVQPGSRGSTVLRGDQMLTLAVAVDAGAARVYQITPMLT